MATLDVVRAWKDEEYRKSLPEDVQAQLPEAPDNVGELSDEQLQQAAGCGLDIELNDVINININI